MHERRKLERQRTFLGAVILSNERASTMECVVRNLSSKGARLSFYETQTIPARFELAINRKKSTHYARIAWRGPTEAGLAFENEAVNAPVPLEWARRLRKSEAENAALRRRIEELSTGY
ncbi:MAG TPA: PilZ domain-containing protein [Pseudolabrys sp.]|nr:PilZ domain-containing protein [Pseudolabrys sp.]